MEKLQLLKEEAIQAIENSSTLVELQEKRVLYLGKKGPIQDVMKTMKDLAPEDRPAFGAQVNEIKKTISDLIETKKVELEEKEMLAQLEKEKIDITLEGYKPTVGNVHPLTLVQQELEDLFIGLGYTVAEGPEVELDLYNFERANIPQGHPARDMQDTFYIDETTLMRTHTSPVQARTLLACKGEGPVRIICPGRVYRRDDDDATHSHQFNQIEGLVVDKDITMADLKGTLDLIAKKMFGEKRTIRLRSSYFPFTEPSVEVDVSCNCNGKGCPVCKGTGWIEILGAGMVHPNVLRGCGFDPEVYQGFAFGIGADRIAMLRYGINDIRHFYNNDLRILNQFKKER